MYSIGYASPILELKSYKTEETQFGESIYKHFANWLQDHRARKTHFNELPNQTTSNRNNPFRRNIETIYAQQFVDKLSKTRTALVAKYGQASETAIYRLCREYIQTIERQALEAERQMQIAVLRTKTNQSQDVYIPVYNVVDVSADQTRQRLQMIVERQKTFGDFDAKKVYEDISKSLRIGLVAAQWSKQIDLALSIIDAEWAKVNDFYEGDKRTAIKSERDEYLRCKGEVDNFASASHASEFLNGIADVHRDIQLNKIHDAIKDKMSSIFSCIENGQILSNKLIEFFSSFLYEDRLNRKIY